MVKKKHSLYQPKKDNLKTVKIVTISAAILATVIALGAGVGDRWVVCATTGSLAVILYVSRMIMED